MECSRRMSDKFAIGLYCRFFLCHDSTTENSVSAVITVNKGKDKA